MGGSKDLRMSNLKGILIFLVVFGHFIEIYKKEYYELFVFIYAFHMPVFIFISGYFAKRMRISKIINLILLYLIFQTFFNIILFLTGDTPFQFTYGEPHFHLWYIVSLGVWYSIVYVISKFNLNARDKWIVFFILCIIGFMSRWYTDDIVEFVKQFYDNFSSYTLSYQRTLSFMPFFFVGYFMNKETLQSVYESIQNNLATWFVLVITIFISFYYFQMDNDMESVFRGSYGIHRYLEDSDGFFVYSLKIGVHYLLALWLCYLLCIIVSNNVNILTKWGDNSLTIFLFHPVFVFVLRQSEFMDDWDPLTKVSFCLMVAMMVTLLLSNKYFVKYTKWMCNPYNTIKNVFH